MLEALAKVTPSSSGPFENFLQDERARLPWGTTLLFILSDISPLLRQLFVGLKESGHKLAVFQTGGTGEGDTPDAVPRYHIGSRGDLAFI
jgi:hypothetical protein